MKKRTPVFTVCCVVFLFIFAAFMPWYLLSVSSIRTSTAGTIRNIETGRGRIVKQQYEYDQVAAELPRVQAELLEKRPLAEAAARTATELKSRKKSLEQEKQSLEEQLSAMSASQEGEGHE